MSFEIRHSLPGRMRVRYETSELSPVQAELARRLLAVQDGIITVDVTFSVGSLLIRYSPSLLSERGLKALLDSLSSKYLEDEEMLSSVSLPEKQENLVFTLLSMTARFVLRRVLPMPPLVRLALRSAMVFPRIFKGVENIFAGKVFSTSTLDAVAITAALASGDYRTAGNINFFLNVGETVEEFTKRKSLGNLASALISDNDPVRLVEGDEEKIVPANMLKAGDVVAVRDGELIPVDGTVVRGEALVNQAALTGEPIAVEKRSGLTVFAGTVLEEGEIFVEVRAVGNQTKVKNILAMIGSSEQLKVSSQIRSEKLAERLVKYNFLLAAGTFLFTRDMLKVTSLLMVDYSCAMKLAAPVAVLSAMREAAENGIVVKGGKFLEEAARADTVVFDKTGTITNAAPELSRIIPFGGRSEVDLLKTAACLEEHFAHPVARAVVQAATDRGCTHPEEHAKVEYIVAHGIATRLHGRRLLLGSRHFVFDDEKIPAPDSLAAIQKDALEKGESLLFLSEENELAGVFAVNDPPRPDADKVVRDLYATGIKECVMISGDDDGAVKSAACAAGLKRYMSRALPEDKVTLIKTLQSEGRSVLMVGDGINDAPALAAADVGVAMGDCADIAGETADIELSSADGLEGLLKTRLLGTGLLRRIEADNAGIVAVNSLLLLGSLCGFLTPSMAAVLHNSSTVYFTFKAARPFLDE